MIEIVIDCDRAKHSGGGGGGRGMRRFILIQLMQLNQRISQLYVPETFMFNPYTFSHLFQSHNQISTHIPRIITKLRHTHTHTCLSHTFVSLTKTNSNKNICLIGNIMNKLSFNISLVWMVCSSQHCRQCVVAFFFFLNFESYSLEQSILKTDSIHFNVKFTILKWFDINCDHFNRMGFFDWNFWRILTFSLKFVQRCRDQHVLDADFPLRYAQ